MQSKSSSFNSQNVSSLVHKGSVLGTVQKLAPRQASLAGGQTFSGSTSVSGFHMSESQSANSKMKLRSVSKISKKSINKSPEYPQITYNKNQAVSFDYILIVFCDDNDTEQYRTYIETLKNSQHTYKRNLKFVYTLDEFKEISEYLMNKQTHKSFILLTGQYSAVNYREKFSKMNRIMIVIDSQQQYSNCSYLLKSKNIGWIMYDFEKVDQKLIEFNILRPEIKVSSQLSPSFLLKMQKRYSNKQNGSFYDSSLSSSKSRQNWQCSNSNRNRQQRTIQSSENPHLPMYSGGHISQKTQESIIDKANNALDIDSNKQLKKSSQNSLKSASKLRSSQLKNQYQLGDGDKNITFKRLSSKKKSSIKATPPQKAQSNDYDDYGIKNTTAALSVNLNKVYQEYDKQIRKIALQQKLRSQSQSSTFRNSNLNSIESSERKSSSDSVSVNKNNRKKISKIWYAKFLKNSMQSYGNSDEKDSRNAQTADAEFYKKDESKKIIDWNKEDTIGVQCNIDNDQRDYRMNNQ